MYIYDKGLLTSFRQKVHVYKQFSEMYISTLLGSPKLSSFLFEQHPTYRPTIFMVI